MMSEDERAGERAAAIDDAISRVRGQAEATGRLIVLEVDAYKRITQLRLTPQAMGADTARLASIITELHRLACEKAEAAATRELAAVSAKFGPPPTPAISAAADEEWGEPDRPLRTTYSI